MKIYLVYGDKPIITLVVHSPNIKVIMEPTSTPPTPAPALVESKEAKPLDIQVEKFSGVEAQILDEDVKDEKSPETVKIQETKKDVSLEELEEGEDLLESTPLIEGVEEESSTEEEEEETPEEKEQGTLPPLDKEDEEKDAKSLLDKYVFGEET